MFLCSCPRVEGWHEVLPEHVLIRVNASTGATPGQLWSGLACPCMCCLCLVPPSNLNRQLTALVRHELYWQREVLGWLFLMLNVSPLFQPKHFHRKC